MKLARQFGFRERHAALLRVALIICAWQGPLPHGHRHAAGVDSADEQSAEDSAWLVEHLRIWHCGPAHGGGDACSNECRKWHWHFEYPHPAEDGPHAPGPANDFPVTIAAPDAEIPSPAQGLSSRPGLGTVDLHSRQVAQLESPGRNTAAHFFDGFAPTLPLPLRFCVARL